MRDLSDDFVIVSRSIYTARHTDEVGPGAVRVRNGRIVDVAMGADASKIGHSSVVDLKDKPLLPGFVDPHAHSEVMARTEATTIDCRAPERENIAAVLGALRANLHAERDGWVVGQANLFFDQKLEERRFPTREELDGVSRDVAIALRCGGHLTVLNSKGLERAGITSETGSGLGSVTGRPSVEVDAHGRPTGVVKEMDRLLPLPTLSDQETEIAISEALERRFTRYGVTTIGEITESAAGVAAFDKLLATGAPIPRMRLYLWAPGFAPFEDTLAFSREFTPASTNGLLSVHGIKVFADGGYSAKSAAMTRPYRDMHDHRGDVAFSPEQLVEMLVATDEQGLQLAVHANGDMAQRVVCEAFASVPRGLRGNAPKPRIEHAGNFMPDYSEQAALWASADITPVPQPVFLYNFGEFVPEYVGDYARRGQFPLRSLLADGWAVSGSSDVWVGSETAQTNPFLSIASAVGRRSFHGHLIEAHESVTLPQAIQMHTLFGARAMGIEDETGSIEVGKRADFAVLDADPIDLDPSDYLSLGIEQVYRDGEKLFSR